MSLRVVLAGTVGRHKRELADALAGAPSSLGSADRLSVSSHTRSVRCLSDASWDGCAVPVAVVEAPDLCGADKDALPADAAAYMCDVELPRSLDYSVDAVVLVVAQGRVSASECQAMNAVLADCTAPRIVAVVPTGADLLGWIVTNEAELRMKTGLNFDAMVAADDIPRLRTFIHKRARFTSLTPPVQRAPPASFADLQHHALHVIAFGEVTAGLGALLQKVSERRGRGATYEPLFSCPVEMWSDATRQQNAVVVHVMPELCAVGAHEPWPSSKSKKALRRVFARLASARSVLGLWAVSPHLPNQLVGAIVEKLIHVWPGVPFVAVADDPFTVTFIPPTVRRLQLGDPDLRVKLLRISRAYYPAVPSDSAAARRLFAMCVDKRKRYRRRALASVAQLNDDAES